MASSLNNPAWLEWMATLMGGASRQTYAATLPPNSFYCLLDELPLHLIPQRVVKSLLKQSLDQKLYLNPACIVCANGQLPDEVASRSDLVSGFALQGSMAWVRSLASGNLLPFWLGPKLERVLRELRPNAPVPDSISESTQTLLTAAGILIAGNDTEETARRKSEQQSRLKNAALLFREKGYAPLSELIHPFHVAALRRYYRYLIRSGAICLGDGQSPRRYVGYNEPVARFFHHDIATILSTVAGQPLKPSYVYMASYLSGAELKKHTDRAQCEFSVTLCLDFSPEPALETPWPIRLDTANSTVAVYQSLGDGLAYRGTRLPHYRDPLDEGQTSTSIFFHYVTAEFAGSLD